MSPTVPCPMCGGLGVLHDSGPAPAPAGDTRGLILKKACGCFEFIAYGSDRADTFLQELNAGQIAPGAARDGLLSELDNQPPCPH